MLPAQLTRLRTGFVPPKNPDDLLLGKSRSLQMSILSWAGLKQRLEEIFRDTSPALHVKMLFKAKGTYVFPASDTETDCVANM